MDKEAMKQLIMESLSRKLGDGYHISICKILKTNLKRDALVILQNGKSCAPTIYLEPFYRELEEGEPIDDVTSHIIQLNRCAEADMLDFDAASIENFNDVKNKLYVQLINRHSNAELLQDVPHSFFLDDFAVVVRCKIRMPSDRNANFLVHNSHLEMWATDQTALLSAAVQNTREVFGIDLRNMDDILLGMHAYPGKESLQSPIWVMTNRLKTMGAATALFDDVLRQFADTHGSFHVIFSSVHELLLIPEKCALDKDFLTQINQEVNATDVQQDEVLGTKAYYYSKDEGFVL